MNPQHWKKIAITVMALAGLTFLAAGSCASPAQDKATQVREDKAKNVILCGEKGESQECINLRKKFQRDNEPNRISYVYTMSWTGEFIGYYVVKGKVSSNQSQIVSCVPSPDQTYSLLTSCNPPCLLYTSDAADE